MSSDMRMDVVEEPVAAPAAPATESLAWKVTQKVGPKTLLIIGDLVAVAVALGVALFVRNVAQAGPLAHNESHYLQAALLSLPMWPVFFANARLYSARYVTRYVEEFRRIVRGCFSATVGLAALLFMTKAEVTRGWVILTFLFSVCFVSLERWGARRMFVHFRRQGRMLRPVVVVGGNLEGLAICHMLAGEPSLGYEVRGFVDDEHPGVDAAHRHLGPVERTLDAIRATGSTGVIIAATAMDLGTSNRLIRELTDHGIHVELSSTLRDIASHRLTVRPLGRFPVVYVEPVQRHGWRSVAKRALDVVLASIGLLVASPILLATAIAVKLDSKGPVLFKQKRVGRNGELFEVLKIRTMVVNAEELLIDLREANEADGPLFKMKKDPRITRVGNVLRKFSIDEIPQLWNVMRNEMSMVGPRPALPDEMQHWNADLHGRLRVKPGITGMWQVNGRSSSSFEDYERLDLYYVDNWSLATDLAIVLRTVPAVVLRKGAF